MCEVWKISGAMKEECKTMKIKNKCQVTMTKGNRSASRQGNDLLISDVAGGNGSVRSMVCDQGGNVKANAQCPMNSLNLYFILLAVSTGYSTWIQVKLDLFPTDPSPSLTCFPQMIFTGYS